MIDVVVGATRRAGIGGARHVAAELVARARRRAPEALVVAQADAHQVDHRVLHRHFHVLAAAGGMALLQRRQDADGHVHAGAGIADGRIDEGRRILGEAGDAHRAAHGLRDRLEALEAAVGAVGAEALDGRVDQARVDLGELLVAEAQPVQRARAEVLDQHVRLADHLLEQLACPPRS